MKSAKGKQTIRGLLFATGMMLATLVLFGCARKGPVLVDFSYVAPKGTPATAPKATVAVSPFKDDRGKVASVVGKRFSELSDQSNDLVVQGAVVDRVTEALKTALTSRGFTEKDVPAWDLSETAIAATGTDLLVGGEIKALWVETTASLAKITAKADVQLRIVVADTAQKKIVRVLNVNSKLERQAVTYSSAFVQKTVSEALTTAIDQVFLDDELKSRLQ